MQIDWFTFLAQILNLLLLIWLLKRFLYGPVIEAMDRREEGIRSQLEEAERKREEANEERRRYDRQLEELDAKRDAMISEAYDDADRKRKELTRTAREDVAALERQWYDDLDSHRQAFLEEMATLTTRHVMNITRRVVGDLSDADLNQKLVEAFCKRIQSIEEDERTRLAEAARRAAHVEVAVAGPVEAALKERLEESLREIVGHGVEFVFVESPGNVLGIEATIGDKKLSWSTADYLERMESAAAETIDEEIGRRMVSTSGSSDEITAPEEHHDDDSG